MSQLHKYSTIPYQSGYLSKRLGQIVKPPIQIKRNHLRIALVISICYLFALLPVNIQAQALQSYQQQALAQNPSLQAKHKEFEAAMTKVNQVNSLPDPTISIGYFISPVETRLGPQRARLSLTQMFPWFGTLKAQGDATALQAEATYEQFLNAQYRIKFEVAKAYFPLVELHRLIAIQKKNLRVLYDWKQLVITQYENGKISLADVLRLGVFIQEMETELDLMQGREKPLTVGFNRLLNREDTAAIEVDQVLAPTLTTLPQEVNWSNHPMVREYGKRIDSREKQALAIQKQSLPKIGAGIDYVMISERTDMSVPDSGKDALMPMVSMSIPIFRKKYTSAIKETQLQVEGYQQAIMATQNDLTSQYEQLIYEVQRENELIHLYGIQTIETEKIQQLMLTAFSNSGQDLDELLRIQMQLLTYQMKQVKAETRLHVINENINYLLAGSL